MDSYIVDTNRVNAAVKIKIGLDRVRKRIENGHNTLDNLAKADDLAKDLRRLQDKMTCHDYTDYLKRVA